MPDIAGTIYKTPTEVIPFESDFKDIIPSDQSVLGNPNSFIRIFDDTGADVTATMLEDETISGTKVQGIIKAGSNNEVYIAQAVAKTTDYRFEAKYRIIVAE